MIYQEWYLKSKWFNEATPLNPVAASATLTFGGVISDTEKVVVGSNIYEFDINDTATQGNIKVDISEVRNKAIGTLTFVGAAIVTETVVISDASEITETYEFVAAAEGIADPGNIAVVLGADLTADNAVTTLAEAINANSELVTAIADTEDDTVVVTATVFGTAGNAYTTTDTCTNADFGGGNLAGGLDTVTAINGAAVLTDTINANELLVTATDGGDGTMVLSYNTVGTAGNGIAVSTDAANGSWGESVTKLSGGQFGVPCPEVNTLLKDDNYFYLCTKEGNTDNVEWKRFTLASF